MTDWKNFRWRIPPEEQLTWDEAIDSFEKRMKHWAATDQFSKKDWERQKREAALRAKERDPEYKRVYRPDSWWYVTIDGIRRAMYLHGVKASQVRHLGKIWGQRNGLPCASIDAVKIEGGISREDAKRINDQAKKEARSRRLQACRPASVAYLLP